MSTTGIILTLRIFKQPQNQPNRKPKTLRRCTKAIRNFWIIQEVHFKKKHIIQTLEENRQKKTIHPSHPSIKSKTTKNHWINCYCHYQNYQYLFIQIIIYTSIFTILMYQVKDQVQCFSSTKKNQLRIIGHRSRALAEKKYHSSTPKCNWSEMGE